MKKIILEKKFNFYQTVIISGAALLNFVILFQMFRGNLSVIGFVITIPFCLSFLPFVALAFCKKGLIVMNDKLYVGLFAFDFLFWMSHQKTMQRPAVSILTFKKNQKLGFLAAANPDYADSFQSYDIYLLSENHIQRDIVLYLKSRARAEQGIEFIEKHLAINYEIFSPNFNR